MVGDGASAAERLSFFDDRGPAYVPCAHGLLADERQQLPVYEWTHGNGVVWVEATDELVVGARLLDAVLGVDRQTGEVRWQLGGRDATIAFADAALAFSHGHFSEAWDGGLLMFDNGSHRAPQASRVVEYAVGPDGADATWVYVPPDGRFVSYLGDAHHLPDDHVLIAWGDRGELDELDRAGQTRWHLALGPDEVIGRVQFLPTFPP
jgi:hypothetical protein